jgi:hypothetical protein
MSASTLSIAKQNDVFRQACNLPIQLNGKYVHTAGIEALGLELVLQIWNQVRGFDSFDADNDPHDEHDFGSFEHVLAGKVFWKIDYYDLDLQYGSEDPADPAKTKRVLTVMLASEY